MSAPVQEEYEDRFEEDAEVEGGDAEGEDTAADNQAVENDEEEESEDDDVGEEPAAKLWTGLARLPERAELLELLKELRGAGRKQLTVLLLGKSSVGKSSIVNSLLGEAAVRVQAFKLQADTEITTTVVRQVAVGDPEVDGLRLKLIDTCGLEDPEAGDSVNWGALAKISEDLRGVGVDVVLYVDRLDLYRVDPLDGAIIAAISQTFGRQIWRRTVLVLTHANLAQTPPGTTYDSFADGRIRQIRAAIRGRLPLPFRPALPAILAENADTCPVNPTTRHRILPDGSEWLLGLAGDIIDGALAKKRPYKYHPRLSAKPSQRFRWLLPVVIAAEILFYRRVIRPALESRQQLVEKQEDDLWAARTRQRRNVGLHAPHRPAPEAAWRLEQMYDDD